MTEQASTQTLPTRPLGDTGYNVSVFSLGGVKYNMLDDEPAAAIINRAIDLGINYIDTAHGYKNSEEKLGLVVPHRRDEIFLATKSTARSGDEMAEHIEQSFERLKTDIIDCYQIHDLKDEDDLAAALAPNGAVKTIEKYQRDGRIRHIGVTGHRDPQILAKALNEYPFDTILVALGPIHQAIRPFYDIVIPAATENYVAVLAMKTIAAGWLQNHVEQSFRYVLNLPEVASTVVGVDTLDQLEQNFHAACNAKPLTDEEQSQLLQDAAALYHERPDDAWFLKKDL